MNVPKLALPNVNVFKLPVLRTVGPATKVFVTVVLKSPNPVDWISTLEKVIEVAAGRFRAGFVTRLIPFKACEPTIAAAWAVSEEAKPTATKAANVKIKFFM